MTGEAGCFLAVLSLADWVDVCRSGRRYGSPLSSGSSKNTGAAAAAATVSSDRGEKKCQTQRTDRFPPNPSFRRVFRAPTALPESDTTPRETFELTNYSRDPTQMFNEEI